MSTCISESSYYPIVTDFVISTLYQIMDLLKYCNLTLTVRLARIQLTFNPVSDVTIPGANVIVGAPWWYHLSIVAYKERKKKDHKGRKKKSVIENERPA